MNLLLYPVNFETPGISFWQMYYSFYMKTVTTSEILSVLNFTEIGSSNLEP